MDIAKVYMFLEARACYGHGCWSIIWCHRYRRSTRHWKLARLWLPTCNEDGWLCGDICVLCRTIYCIYIYMYIYVYRNTWNITWTYPNIGDAPKRQILGTMANCSLGVSESQGPHRPRSLVQAVLEQPSLLSWGTLHLTMLPRNFGAISPIKSGQLPAHCLGLLMISPSNPWLTRISGDWSDIKILNKHTTYICIYIYIRCINIYIYTINYIYSIHIYPYLDKQTL